jgi:2'-5' RNA ligase
VATTNEHRRVSASEGFRLFIALPVPQTVKDELRRAQNDLRAVLECGGVRWTRPEQIHLTLKFIGNVPSSDVRNLVDATVAACCPFSPIRLQVRGIGFFPSGRRPRVIWADVREEGKRLRGLHAAVSIASTPFTTEKNDKEFAAHLTLARLRDIGPNKARLLGEAARGMSERNFGDWTADKVEIVRSELDSAGSRYSSVGEVILQATK